MEISAAGAVCAGYSPTVHVLIISGHKKAGPVSGPGIKCSAALRVVVAECYGAESPERLPVDETVAKSNPELEEVETAVEQLELLGPEPEPVKAHPVDIL